MNIYQIPKTILRFDKYFKTAVGSWELLRFPEAMKAGRIYKAVKKKIAVSQLRSEDQNDHVKVQEGIGNKQRSSESIRELSSHWTFTQYRKSSCLLIDGSRCGGRLGAPKITRNQGSSESIECRIPATQHWLNRARQNARSFWEMNKGPVRARVFHALTGHLLDIEYHLVF